MNISLWQYMLTVATEENPCNGHEELTLAAAQEMQNDLHPVDVKLRSCMLAAWLRLALLGKFDREEMIFQAMQQPAVDSALLHLIVTGKFPLTAEEASDANIRHVALIAILFSSAGPAWLEDFDPDVGILDWVRLAFTASPETRTVH